MSMQSEQIRELEKLIEVMKDDKEMNKTEWNRFALKNRIKIIQDAIWTIKEQGAKLAAYGSERSLQYFNGGWIPTADRKPSEYGNYLCTLSNDDVQECTYSPEKVNGWSTCEADGYREMKDSEVIAYMPLPEPYKNNEERS